MGNSMTKEEAVRKWCPFIGYRGNGEKELCIADFCALWQWDYKTDSAGPLPESKWRGHCGLIQQ